MSVSDSIRWQVVERAGNRCEYCGLSQEGQEAVFHVHHIFPVSLGGVTELDNLALACVSCSLRKAARVQVPDPASGEQVAIFHPRNDRWNLHFRWSDCEITGITPTGRATAAALMMNRPMALRIRAEERARGRHPPPGQL